LVKEMDLIKGKKKWVKNHKNGVRLLVKYKGSCKHCGGNILWRLWSVVKILKSYLTYGSVPPKGYCQILLWQKRQLKCFICCNSPELVVCAFYQDWSEQWIDKHICNICLTDYKVTKIPRTTQWEIV
jgi:hypothetical protein